MKKLFFLAAALFAACSLSACSDEEENSTLTPDQIIGTWQITLDQGWATYADGTRDDWSVTYPDASDGNYYWTYTFREEGTCVRESHADYYTPGENHTDEYSYTIAGNRLTMKCTTDSDLDFACTIQSLSSKQLVLYTRDTEASISHEEFEETEIYKRVK